MYLKTYGLTSCPEAETSEAAYERFRLTRSFVKDTLQSVVVQCVLCSQFLWINHTWVGFSDANVTESFLLL